MSDLPPGLPVTYLTYGFHTSPEDGLCLVEAAAYLAGEPHGDRPLCVCPALAAFGRALNDGPWSSAEARTDALGPLVALLAGSRATRRVERARAVFLARRALTAYAPLALASAVLSLEAIEIDCSALRAAALLLCEKPSPESADAARAAAAAADAAAYAFRDAAAARAAAAAAASAAAARHSASGGWSPEAARSQRSATVRHAASALFCAVCVIASRTMMARERYLQRSHASGARTCQRAARSA